MKKRWCDLRLPLKTGHGARLNRSLWTCRRVGG